MKLNEKYVFHIPLYRYSNGELVPLEIDDPLDDLIEKLSENGYENLYMVNAKGFYKRRRFDEILLTIYITSDKSDNHLLPDEIFKTWFKNHNDMLQQEAMGYEYNNQMFVEKNINR